MGDKSIIQQSLLQDGVSCALATLYAVQSGELFGTLPEDKAACDRHGHGSWLLAMLQDHLTQIQQKVDALDEQAVIARAEG